MTEITKEIDRALWNALDNSTEKVVRPVDRVVSVTNHAAKRFKQRCGLPKKACQSHAQTAYDKGYKHVDAKGRAKRYMDKVFLEHRKANQMRVYGEFIYLFAGTVLITVMNLPKSVRGGFKH